MNSRQRLVVITGMSGAGKSQALRFFEDQGYYCVDNLPAQLVPKFTDISRDSSAVGNRIALGVDARSGDDLRRLPGHLGELRNHDFDTQVLFLDSSDDTLLKRYSETRRPHPIAPHGTIAEGIMLERKRLQPMLDIADMVLDTSDISTSDLRERIATMAAVDHGEHTMAIEVLSFGFKFGLPREANIVLDVRFLPNPYWDEDLRPLNGMDPEVRDFVTSNPQAKEFFKHSKAMLKYLIPQYEAEPKAYLTIAIGCTGGKHRSVAMAHEVLRLLRDMHYDARLRHRDIGRDNSDLGAD
jgi:RNase adapter protein RapZ